MQTRFLCSVRLGILGLALFCSASAQALTWNNDTPVGAPAAAGVRGFWGTSATNIYAAVGSNGSVGRVYRWDGSAWNTVGGTTFDTSAARSIIGFGTQEIWVGGLSGIMRRSLDAGANWTMVNSGADVADRFTSIWGASNTDIWSGGLNATSNSGMLRRYNGSTWAAVSHPFGVNEITGIWGTSANSIFFVGNGGTIAFWNGTSLNTMTSGTTQGLAAVWGLSANEVYAVGANATILKWNGTAWAPFSNTGIVSTVQLNGITGTSSNDLYVCTGNGATNLYHWDGSTWTLETTAGNSLLTIWISPDSSRYVAGGASSRLYGATAAAPAAPEISVSETGVGNITDGTSFSFASVTQGSPSAKTFTITNSGTVALNLSGTPKVDITGTNAGDFVVTSAQPASPVGASGGTATFTVTFTPGGIGARTADLSIANDDTDENPFNFTLSGTGNAPPPTVTSVTSTTADGAYHATQSIDISVVFSAPVTVTGGPPQITLETGVVDRTLAVTSGSGTNTLHFSYSVQSGDTSPDLDYISTSALALAGGTINATSGGTPAVLTLPAPGAAGSLGANKNIVIDTTPPTVQSVTRLSPGGQNTNATMVTFRVTYSEPVNLTAPLTTHYQVMPVNGSTITGTVQSVTGSGNTRDVTVQITGGTGEFRLRVLD